MLKVELPSGYIGGGTVVGLPTGDPTGAGATSLWDSVLIGVEAMAAIKSTGSRKVVLLFSDGVNTYGEKKMKEAVDASMRRRIAVFAVGIGDDYYGGIDRKNLKKLTEQTNGITIVPDKKLTDLPPIMKVLEQSLRFTYELTFDNKSAANGKTLQETRIEIVNPELKKRKLKIVQPKGYFPSN